MSGPIQKTILLSIVATTGGLTLASCGANGAFTGTLVDGMTGEPRAEVRVLARAGDGADLSCNVREATTDAAGTFTIANTCGGVRYALGLPDESLLLVGAPAIEGGQPAGPTVKLTTWRAPAGGGVYRLADDTLTPIKTFSDVATEKALGSGDPIRYPTRKPTKAPAIAAGQWLVISGKAVVDRMELVPLVPDTGPRAFDGAVTITDHVYLGAKFLSDNEYEKVAATVDTATFQDVTEGERTVRYIPAASVGAGMYGLLGPKDKRLFVVQFGA